MGMSINNLRVFVAVADAGNLTRAAEALFMSQPAASRAVRAVEDELGVDLFVRDKRSGLTLTDTGERVLSHARELMLAEERIYQDAYRARNLLEGTLRVASLPSGVEFFLADALVAFRQEHPQVEVVVREGSSGEVREMVATHAAELGIGILPGGEFPHETLMEDSVVAFSRDPLPEVVDLVGLPGTYYACASALESILPVLEAQREQPRARFKTVAASSVRALARAGMGCGLQAESLVRGLAGCNVRPVTPEVRCDLALFAPDLSRLTPAASAFAEVLRDVARACTSAPWPMRL